MDETGSHYDKQITLEKKLTCFLLYVGSRIRKNDIKASHDSGKGSGKRVSVEKTEQRECQYNQSTSCNV